MVTTNILQLVNELDRLGAVRIQDHMDTIDLHVAKPVDMEQVDDLICDALFVDPMDRREGVYDWTIRLMKRSQLRSGSDMSVKQSPGRSVYILHQS